MKLSDTLQKVSFWVILLTAFLFPLFFLPLTSDFYDFNKLALLIVSTSLLLVLLTAGFVVDRQVRLIRSPLGLPLLVLLASWLLSTFLRTPNRWDTLVEVGQTSTIVALVLFTFAFINIIRSKKEVEGVFSTLLISNLVLAAVSVLWYSGLMPQIIPLPFLKSQIWTPTGIPITTLVLLGSFLPFQIILILKEKPGSKKSLLLLSSVLLSVIATGLIAYRLFNPQTGSKPVFLSQQTSWIIAMESIKVSPLLGTGPSTFLSDFNLFRPAAYNLTREWAIRFNSSSNYYLQILSTLGLLGVAAYLLLAMRTVQLFMRSIRSSSESPLRFFALSSSLTALILLVSFVFIPPSASTLFSFFLLLALTISTLKQLGSSLVYEANIDIVAATETGIRAPILPIISLILVFSFVVPSIYQFSKAYIAEYYFRQALLSANANNGRATYQGLLSAMRFNPRRDIYRVAYSQTNFLLANSASTQPNLTDQDRESIVRLVQQAIREAKNAVTLNPNKANNMENLASIYRNLINLAQGADGWAVAAYTQAARLDPVNPTTRISMGGIYFAQKQYDRAIELFQQAINLKPDLANAYYNLSAAYREKGDYKNAVSAMQFVLTYVDRTSPDFSVAQAEIEELKKKAGETSSPVPATATGPSQLEAPQPLPTPRLKPPLELPADLGPEPATPSSVTSTPTPTTNPSAFPLPTP